MKKIKKPKNQVIVVPTTQKTKSQKTSQSAIDYYNCLLTSAQQGWLDPVTGTKKKITACCKNCKLNAPRLNDLRNQEIQKLILSYQQVGDSLTKLLRPLSK